MFPSQLVLAKEKKDMEKLKRMRMNEEERMKRIFNPKQRMIGIDKKELDAQRAEKKMGKDIEKAMEDKYYRQQVYAVSEADRLENEILKAKRRLNEEIIYFQKTYQRKSNECDQLDKSTCPTKPGISSGLIFDGEDNSAKERKLLQIEQQKCWLVQQMSEKNLISNDRKLAEKIHTDFLKAKDNRALAMEHLEEECRRQKQLSIKEYNEALAREHIFKKISNYKKENEDNKAEIQNAITSDLLTENTETAQSNLGPGKIIQYQYKGMSEREKLQIQMMQMQQIRERQYQYKGMSEREKLQIQIMQIQQIRERQVQIDDELTYNQKWDNFYKHMDNLQLMNDESRKAEERAKSRLNMETNKLLHLNIKAQEMQRKREDSSNFSTPEFLNQFNKTTR